MELGQESLELSMQEGLDDARRIQSKLACLNDFHKHLRWSCHVPTVSGEDSLFVGPCLLPSSPPLPSPLLKTLAVPHIYLPSSKTLPYLSSYNGYLGALCVNRALANHH
jgi:hypothetical protein